jgi:(1->4)-alpha-D-glucan 1-alpha-D-glucosylmutase
MAKGLEDTAFYRYNRFTALNEVGGDPDQFGVSIASFHHGNTLRAKRWPHSILTTSTHDTKRGEDARARLAVLSEMPQEWATQVETWSRILRARRREIGVGAPPDRNDEYLFYQLLVGSWPMEMFGCAVDKTGLKSYVGRLKDAMRKSLREAKVHSTWQAPNAAYEDAVLSFIDDAMDVERSDAFFSAFLPFVGRVARLGVQNSLVQLTLKLTAPGVPDLYQGSELWDLSMVDPDNRRHVDYPSRCRALKLLDRDLSPKTLLHEWTDGAIKIFITEKLLKLRKAKAELFASGGYESVAATDYICGFERRDGEESVVILTARYPVRREAEPEWVTDRIAVSPRPQGKTLVDIFTGNEIYAESCGIQAGVVFAELPVAVLVTGDGAEGRLRGN